MEEKFFEKVVRHDIDIFRHRLHIVVTTDPNASGKKHISTWTREEPIRAMHIILNCQGNSMLLLPFDITPGEVAHECMHALMHIMDEIGATYKEGEFVCYSLGYIVDLVHTSLEKAKKAKEVFDKSQKQ
jgi:hypothetical protein